MNSPEDQGNQGNRDRPARHGKNVNVVMNVKQRSSRRMKYKIVYYEGSPLHLGGPRVRNHPDRPDPETQTVSATDIKLCV